MTYPTRTNSPAVAVPTTTEVDEADLQLLLTEMAAQIDWGFGKIVSYTGSGTKSPSAATLDGQTVIVCESLSGAMVLQLPYADQLCTAGGAGAPLAIVRRDSSAYTLTVELQSGDKINGVAAWTSVPLAADGDTIVLRPMNNDTFRALAVNIRPVPVEVVASNASYAVPAGCDTVRIRDMVGEGGGSGGVDGQASANFNGYSGAGGGAAWSAVDIDVRAVATLALVVPATGGAAGTAGANDGGNGSQASVSDGIGTVISGGGGGGKGVTAANGAVALGGPGGTPSTSGALTNFRNLRQAAGQPGTAGICLPSTSGAGVSGVGGSTPLGGGGNGTSTAGQVGTAGTGFGAGAGGSSGTNNNAANVAGRIGQPAKIIMELHFLRPPQ